MQKVIEQKLSENPEAVDDGRSRREKRRQAILEAANTLFLEKGYGATSLADIVKESGGSLATLYDLFGGKEGLFHTMIEMECNAFVEFLRDTEIIDSSLDIALRKIGEHIFRSFLEEDRLDLFKLVISEVKHFPEVGEAFYAAGPTTVYAIIAKYLDKQSKLGHLKITQPIIAAKTFISLVVGEYQTELLCGRPVKMTGKQIEKHLDQSVENFLKIYGV